MRVKTKLLCPTAFLRRIQKALSEAWSLNQAVGLAILQPYDSKCARSSYEVPLASECTQWMERRLALHWRENKVHFAGRLANDEFGVFFRAPSSDLVWRQMDRLRRAISTGLEDQSNTLSLTMAGAISAVAPWRMETLYRQTDRLMHRVIQQGRHRIRLEFCKFSDVQSSPKMNTPKVRKTR